MSAFTTANSSGPMRPSSIICFAVRNRFMASLRSTPGEGGAAYSVAGLSSLATAQPSAGACTGNASSMAATAGASYEIGCGYSCKIWEPKKRQCVFCFRAPHFSVLAVIGACRWPALSAKLFD